MVGVAEITFQTPGVLWLLPLVWLLLMLSAWRRRFRPFGLFLLRLAIIVLMALALSRPVQSPPTPAAETETPAEATVSPRWVLLVDQSASLGRAGQEALRNEATRLAAAAPEAITLFFADRPAMAAAALNPETTDIAGALALGAELLADRPGRLILLSDGLPTDGEALPVAARLDQPVDTLLVDEGQRLAWGGSPNEIHLLRLDVPPRLRRGEMFNVSMVIHSYAATEARLRLMSDGRTLAEDVILLESGLNLWAVEARAGEVGPHTFRADVAAAGDGQQANNSLSAFSQVYPAPQILVIGAEEQAAENFANELQKAGFLPEWRLPELVPVRLSELEPYAGMVLLNVSARSLTLEQMLAIQTYVRSLGRGLLVTGGRDSYSLGHYEDTPLADLLPVSLETPTREERPPVALLFIFDHSGSMVETHTEGPTKLAMAKEATIRATDILGPHDLIGILMFDNTNEWVVPFRQVSEGAALLEIEQAVAAIPPGGGTRILDALETALPALAAQETEISARHAILLTDGKSYDGERGIADYNAVVDMAQANDITLSTIAIGLDADQQLLAHLADRGQGRYHFAATPEELPALTVAESDILRSEAIQEGERYQPSPAAPHPMLRGLCFGEACLDSEPLPALTGYIALTPKARAEVALEIGPGDPLLSVWGYGLGRVAAWSSTTGGEWTEDWQFQADVTRFWGQVLDYLLPAPELGLLQAGATVASGGVATITAEGVTATGQTADLARTTATLTTPGGQQIPLRLRQVEPGRYRQTVRLPVDGAYQLDVVQARADGPDETVTTGFVLPYPAEYAWPGQASGPVGSALLRRIADVSGGQTFGPGDSLPPVAGQSSAPVEAEPEPPTLLWRWFLLAALLLWPLEIGWRRWSRLRIQ